MKKAILLFFVLTVSSFAKSFSQNFPDTEWEKNEYPELSGWDKEKLGAIREYVVDSTATTGMLLIHNGKIVFEYGDLTENSYIASCRKSILAMLYGKHVKNGTIDLDISLEDLRIPETELLTGIEKKATIKDIISSRSGVFLPAANGGDLQNLAPERGSVNPGEFWLYNNWDFNMAGYIFEKETGKNIYDDIQTQFAIPLQMQDWNRSLQEKGENPVVTEISAYHMWFSTRDMARLGLLMLNNGKWNDTQVIEKDWVSEMTTPKTSFEEIDKIAPFYREGGALYSYGYMWWLWEDPDNNMLKGAYSAQGAWGQNITVFPEMKTVLVIKTNDLYERRKGSHNRIIYDLTKSYDQESAKPFEDLFNSLNGNDISKIFTAVTALNKKKLSADLQDILNKKGYDYLSSKDFERALRLFEFNVAQYPNAWNLYDSLGEGYFISGDFENALKNYRKAIELNTQNQYNFNDRTKHIIKRIEVMLD